MSIKLLDGARNNRVLSDDVRVVSDLTSTTETQLQWLKDSPNWPTSRSKLDWPFDAESHFNKSIGEDAVYVDCQYVSPHSFEVNHETWVTPSLSDPRVNIYHCNNGAGCFPAANRCIGTAQTIDSGQPTSPVHFPPDVIVTGAGINVGGDLSLDCPAAWTLADLNNDYMYSAGGFCRDAVGGPIYGPEFYCKEPIKGSGYGTCNGRYGGSGIVMRGGSIQESDILNVDDPIKHCCVFWMRPYTYYMDRSTRVAEYRWPANQTDAVWSKYPTGPGLSPNWEPYNLPSSFVVGLKMGALLAIPRSETPNSVGIQTELGLKYFNMLQDYGGYCVNESGRTPEYNRFTMSHETRAHQAVINIYGHPLSFNPYLFNDSLTPTPGTDWYRWMEDMQAMYLKLHVVDDNSQTNIGGAGARRFRPPAPPFID